MPTVKQVQSVASLSIEGFVGKFQSLANNIEDLPKISEKATAKVNSDFNKLGAAIDKVDSSMAEAGKDFDLSKMKSQLKEAQTEFNNTGKVSQGTLQALRKGISDVDFKELPKDAKKAMTAINDSVKDVERQMKKLNDVDFLSDLPEDVRKAGATLLDFEKDVNKIGKALGDADKDVNFNNLKAELSAAKKELQSTGKLSETTMTQMNNSVSKVNFDGLPSAAKRAVNNAIGEFGKLDKEMKNVGANADMSKVKKGFDEAANGAKEATKATDGFIGSLKNIKGGPYAGGILAVGAAFGTVIKGANDTKKAFNEVAVETGATGKELEGLNKVMVDVYSNNFGEDMNDVAKVLGTVRGATHLTGKELQKATENTILLRDSFDWDPTETMNATRAMMKNFNLTSEESMNLLVQGRQQMGEGADDILDTMKEYGSAFSEIGLSGEDAMNMMANSMDAGIVNTDKAADAINEMSILMREMPKTADDAMDTIGLSAGEVQEAFSAGGDKAKNMFFKVTDGLKNVKDDAQRNAAGIGIFGTMWEDAGEKAILALGKTDGKVKQSKKALESLNNVKYDDIGSAAKGVGRMLVANILIPIQKTIMPGINTAIKTMAKFGGAIKSAFASIKKTPPVDILKKLGFSNGAANNIINWFNTLKQNLSRAGGAVKGFFQLFKGNGTEGVISLSKLGLKPETIKALDSFASGVKRNFQLAFGAIGGFAKKGLNEVVKFFHTDGAQILQAVRNIGNVIGTVMKGIWAVMKFVWPAVKMLIVSIWDNIKGVVSGGLQVIKGVIQVFSGLFTGDFKKMWEGIKNIFFGAIKFVWNYVQLMFYGKLLKGGLAFIKIFAGGFKSMWTKIVGFFKTFGGNAVKFLVNAFKSMTTNSTRFFSGMVKGILGLAKKMFNGVINFFKSLGSGTVKLFGSMKTGLSKIWSSITKTAYNAGKYVRDKVVGFFSSLWKNVSAKMTAMKNGLVKLWNSLRKSAYEAGKYIKDKVFGFFSDMWKNVGKKMGDMKRGVGKIWDSMRTAASNFGRNIRKSIGDTFSNMWKTVSGWTKKIGDNFSKMKDNIIGAAKDLAAGIKKHALGGLNTMINGINWVGDKLGMGKQMIKPIEYSTGTGGHPEDGWATVGDKGPGNGKGTRELVHLPNGQSFLAEKEMTFYMPKGTVVENNKDTEKKLSAVRYSTGTPKGAGSKVAEWFGNTKIAKAGKAALNYGKAGLSAVKNVAKAGAKKAMDQIGDVMDYVTNPGKLVDIALEKFGVNFDSIKGVPGKIMGGAYKSLKSAAVKKVKQWFEEANSGGGDGSSFTHYKKTTPYSPNAPVPGYPTAYNGGRHYGIDYLTPAGTTLTAPTSGNVQQQYNEGGGIVARLVNGKFAQYFLHLSKVLKEGHVKQGEAFAKTGNSGKWTNGAHLHYQVESPFSTSLTNRNTIDPEKFLKGHAGGFGGGSGNWANQIRQAARAMGAKVSGGDIEAISTLISKESGGNQSVVQHGYTDVNTGGNEARGLLQYTPGTFSGYAAPGHKNILRGYDQLLAFFNNSNWRGDLSAWQRRWAAGSTGWGPTGHRKFANGGIISSHQMYEGGEEGAEVVIPLVRKRRTRAKALLQMAHRMIGEEPTKYSTGTKKSSKPSTYTVKSGDNLWDISQKNGTTVDALKKLNNLKTNLIFPKQVLKLSEAVKKVTDKISEKMKSDKKTAAKKTAKKPVKKVSTLASLTKTAAHLIDVGKKDTTRKTSKANIDMGNTINAQLANLKSNDPSKVKSAIAAIKKKVDSVVASNHAKIQANAKKIKGYNDKNRDESYNIDALQQERALNGKTGYINVKTRLADGNTANVDKKITASKKELSDRNKKLKAAQEARAKSLASAKKLKPGLKRNTLMAEAARKQIEINKMKKLQEEENKNLKKYEKERAALFNRYKVTRKQVKGRSSAVIDKAIASSKKKISDNKKLIKNIKDESKMFAAQSANLKAIKENELLKKDTLAKIAEKRASLVEKLAKMREGRDALKEEKSGFKDSIGQSMQGYAGFGAAKGNTGRDFLEFMKYRLGRLKKFASNITKLKGMGLDRAILKELIEGGVENAMPKVEALMAGGQGLVTQVNAMQAEVNRVIASLSGEQAGYVYDDQIAGENAAINSVKADIKSTDFERDSVLNAPTHVTSKPSSKKKVTKKTTTKKPTKTSYTTYKIKPGDSLSTIAYRYGTTVATLKKENGLHSDLIIAGKTLKVPSKGTISTPKKTTKEPAKKTTPAKKYLIKGGDTLSGIASKYHTTVAAIKKANGLNSDFIKAGKTLKIPGYATGGIVNIPQLAWIAEGGFAESIISHDPSKKNSQERIWKQTGAELGFDMNKVDKAMMRAIYEVLKDIRDASEVTASKDTSFKVDGRELAGVLTPHVDENLVEKAKRIKRGLIK